MNDTEHEQVAKPAVALVWRSVGGSGISDDLDEHNAAVVAELARLIKAGEKDAVKHAIKRWPPQHLLALIVHLPIKRARKLLGWLDKLQTRVVAELNPAFRSALLEDATVQRLVEVLDGLEPEEAADQLEDLPEEVQLEVLPRLEHRAAIESLRGYHDDSAGSIMSRKFVAVPPGWTVGQVAHEIRANARAIEKLYAVYVVDARHHPLGYLRLRDLLLSPKEARVYDVMNTDFIAVGPDTDQEEVANIADRYELSVVPVVDADGRLIGRITPKQLRRVLREEAEEDRNIMAGLPADTRPDESIARIVRGRIPWLLIGLGGASLSAAVVGSFEDQLARAAILASFIPIVMSMAGNAGIQASTVAVQGLSTGTVKFGDLGWRLAKELLAALANGVIAALVLVALVIGVAQMTDFDAPAVLAASAGLSLMTVVVIAVTVGATVPIVLDRLGIDPAMATGVFITTGNDILSVMIFFLMMSLFYLPLLD
ncbi:MAG: magnesium transporter [Thiohalocapsa sp.]|uniref:magnesium transporter n=1 Tax=Thiohalocapsa sp. TaxID=2497641 RepID=UPI0025E79D48|nr:magnesium transporter [Thiohalocapsa sp.]MCG6942461.1 magnesium transporter [Thiohalocapsa sp.]